MATKSPKALRKLLSGFLGGVSVSSTIFSVVACGEETSTSNKSVIKVPDELAQSLTDSLKTVDGINNLPLAPNHSHWEYKKATDKEFSMVKPKTLLSGDLITVKLVANSDYTLDKQVHNELVVKSDMQKVFVDNLAEKVKNFEINQQTMFSTLPEAPSDSHWEYKVDDGTFSENQPEFLKPGQVVSLELVPELNYFLEEPIFRTDIEVTGIPVSSELKTAVQEIKYGIGMGFKNLPDAPQNTEWVFSIDGGKTFSNSQPGSDINRDVQLQVKLAGIGDFELAENLVTEIMKAEELILSEEIAEKLLQLKASEEKFWLEENLPSAPTGTHWEWRENDGSYSKTAPTNLNPGTKISIKLVSDDNSKVLSKTAELLNFVVLGTINNFDANAKNEELAKTTVNANDGVINLPTAPENSHWEYKVDDGTYSATMPTTFTVGQKVSFKLMADENYVLSDMVERTDVVVSGTVNVPGTLATDLAQTSVEANVGVMNLPTAPENSHWEYKVNNGIYSTTEPATFTVGQKVSFKLMADENYVLSDMVERKDVVVDGTVNLENNGLLSALKKINFAPGTTNTSSEIENLPSAPTNSHWEYKVDDGSYNKEKPTDLAITSLLSVKLVADENYSLSSENVKVENVSFNPVIDFDEYAIGDGTYSVVAYTKSGLHNLPTTPKHTHWEYQVREKIDGNYEEHSADKYSKELPDLNGKGSSLVDFKLFPDDNYKFEKESIPERKGVIVEEGEAISVPDDLSAKLATTKFYASGVADLPTAPNNSHWNIKLPDGSYKELTSNDRFIRGETIGYVELSADSGYSLAGNIKRENILVTEAIPTMNVANELKNTLVSVTHKISNLPAAPANAHWEYSVENSPFTSAVPTAFNAGQSIKFRLVADSNEYSFSTIIPDYEVVVTQAEPTSVPANLQDELNAASNNTINDGSPALNQLPPAPANTHWEYSIKYANKGNIRINKDTVLPYQGEKLASFAADSRKFTIKLVADEGYQINEVVAVTTIVYKEIDLSNTIDHINEKMKFDGSYITNLPEVEWPARMNIYFATSDARKINNSPDDYIRSNRGGYSKQIPDETADGQKVAGIILEFKTDVGHYVDFKNGGNTFFFIGR